MRKDSNELLFERLLEGDGEALRPLMERHGDACMLYVNGYVHDIVATHITDADQSLANLRYISVPNTLAAEVEGFSQVEPFVYAGHDCPFQIDVRNHGNLIIGGFDVEMLDPDRGNLLVDSVHIGAIEPKNILLTASNMGWGNLDEETDNPTPKLTAEEEAGQLMPGKKLSYQATFKIPGDWKGEKRVIMRVVKAWTPGMEVEGLTEDADGAVAHFYHPGTDNTLMLHQADTQALLYDPVETMSKNGGPDVPTDPDDPTDPKDPKDPKQPEDNKSRRGGMPGTSDPFGGLGLAAAAVGGAAALLAGHSARRVRNERAQQEGEEE